MENNFVATEYAPAERESIKVVELQTNTIRQNLLLTKIINAVSEMLVVLNDKRQIIFSNEEFAKAIGLPSTKSFIGKRVGEAVNCKNAFMSEGGAEQPSFAALAVP